MKRYTSQIVIYKFADGQSNTGYDNIPSGGDKMLQIQSQRMKFDVEMSKTFAERRILGRFDVEKAMKIAGFTWRRFAFWVKESRKQLFRECESLIRNNGVLGIGKAKLSRKAHFAWVSSSPFSNFLHFVGEKEYPKGMVD